MRAALVAGLVSLLVAGAGCSGEAADDDGMPDFNHDPAYLKGTCGNDLRTRRYAPALRSCTRAAAVAPDDAQAHYLLALARAYQDPSPSGRAKALESLDESLSLEPSGDAYNLKGVLLTALQRCDEALEVFDLALDPDLVYETPGNAAQNKAEAYLCLQDHDRAIQAFRMAIEFRPRDPGLHLALCGVLRTRKHLDLALAACDRAVELNPASGAAHFERGQVLLELGDNAEAATAFAESLAREPEGPHASSAKRFLSVLEAERDAAAP